MSDGRHEPRDARAARAPRAWRRAPAHERPPGSLLWALLGAFAGGALGHAIAVGAWLSNHPDRTWGAGSARVLASLGSPDVALLVFGCAFAGFMAAGLAVRATLPVAILHATRRLLTVAAGAAAGLAFGSLAFLAVWAISGGRLERGMAQLTRAFGSTSDATPFVLAGLLAGLLGGIYAAGRGVVRSAGRFLGGVTVGAAAGLLVHVAGTIAVAGPPSTPEGWLEAIARAAIAGTPAQWLVVGLAACVGGALARYQWRLYGILTFVALLCVVVGYIGYSLTTTLPAVRPDAAGLSQALFAAELVSLLLVLLYSFYTLDVAARKHWNRAPTKAAFSHHFLPKVAFHVATYNEPPEMVIETIRRLLALDYPKDRYVVMVGDDSTRSESQLPIEAFCRSAGVVYNHRIDRRGYKAGALNALLRMTPADVDIIAVIDADYWVEPEYLAETVGYFVDEGLGWLQTPQDYRNRHQSFLTEQYYLADAYFYRTILPSRNEENSIIFCGTMGMLRKSALEGVGGWSERHITEDAELSTRLLNAGWRSQYVNKTFGRGLIPATFEAYKGQHYRWAFGGGKILRAHWWRLLFGRYTFRQRLDYLVGAFNWFEGALVMAMAVFVLAMGVGDLAGEPVVTHHANEILLVGLVPVLLMVDGLARIHLVLRRSVSLRLGGTVRVLGMWFSVKFSNMRAALKAIVGFRMPFTRTRKSRVEPVGRWQALRRAVRLTAFESLCATLWLGIAVAVALRVLMDPETATRDFARGVLAGWLAYYALVFAAAPVYAYKSYTTIRPDAVDAPEEAPRDVTA